MKSKRSKLEIYLDVLKAVRSGVDKPTNIMYKCNLAWKPFKRILNSLIENGLLKTVETGTRKTYELTEKGRDVLRYLATAETLVATLTNRRQTRQSPFEERTIVFSDQEF